MKRAKLECAVELGLRLYESPEVPVDTLEYILAEFTIQEIQKVFELEIVRVLSSDEREVEFETFMKKYASSRVLKVDSESWLSGFGSVYVDNQKAFLEEGRDHSCVQGGFERSVLGRDFSSTKLSLIRDVFDYIDVEMESVTVFYMPNTKHNNRKEGYYYVELPDFGKRLFFNLERNQGTFVLDLNMDIAGSVIKEFSDFRVSFLDQYMPNLAFYLIVKLLSDEFFEKLKIEFKDKARLQFGVVDDFLSIPLKELSKLRVDGISMNRAFKDLFELGDVGGVLTAEQRNELGSCIWGEESIDSIYDYSAEEICELIRNDFNDLDEFVNCDYTRFAGFKIGLKGWSGICTYLDKDLNPKNNKFDRIRLGEYVFGVEYEEDTLESLIEEIKEGFDYDEYIKMGLRGLSKYRGGKSKVSLVSIYNMLTGERIESLSLISKAIVGKEVWGEKDEIVAELMSEEEWRDYLFQKYSKKEFECLNLTKTKELSFSYHKIASVFGLVGQSKKVSDIKQHILELVWGEN
jgi:hypothetical protein